MFINMIKTKASSYYAVKEQMSSRNRMTTLEEEMNLQSALRSDKLDPRWSEYYKDILPNPENHYFTEGMFTETGIKVPKGIDPERIVTIEGVDYYPRVVLVEKSEVDEVMIPRSVSGAILEYNKYGIPTKTASYNKGAFWSGNATFFTFLGLGSQEKVQALIITHLFEPTNFISAGMYFHGNNPYHLQIKTVSRENSMTDHFRQVIRN